MRRGICHSDFLDCSASTLITNSKSDQGCPLSVLGPFYPFLGGGSDCFLVVLFRWFWVECQLIKEEKKGKDFSEANREMEGDNTVRSKFKRVCVFCGSQSGNRKVFGDAALELGDELVKQKIDLVYGGGSVGLMGLISQKVFDGGCNVLGVIPKALMPLEISGKTIGEVQIVLDMHERKAVMAREADAFIALPGGYGTMEEFMEMITWSQLGIHKKPVGLLNVDGYYNSLLGLFDNGVKEGFIKPGAREIVLSAPTARELLEKMENYNPSHKDVAPHESWQVEKLGDYSRK